MSASLNCEQKLFPLLLREYYVIKKESHFDDKPQFMRQNNIASRTRAPKDTVSKNKKYLRKKYI